MKPASEEFEASYLNGGLAALSLASGCTDVLSFLKLGNLFTSAMTGNTALLAIELAQGKLLGASRGLTALLGFSLGVALAARLNAAWQARLDGRRRFRRLLMLELVFLTAAAALWYTSPDPVQGIAVYTVILLSALSMGIQAVAAGSVVSGINTIVFTSLLVRAVMSITAALSSPREGSRRLAQIRPHLAAFAAYGCGAFLAAILISHHFRALIWMPAAAVVFALGLAELASRLERSKR
ncbi:MAG: YoaK family protein [Rhodomicrobium sp.]